MTHIRRSIAFVLLLALIGCGKQDSGKSSGVGGNGAGTSGTAEQAAGGVDLTPST